MNALLTMVFLGLAWVPEAAELDSKSCSNGQQCDSDTVGLLQAKVEAVSNQELLEKLRAAEDENRQLRKQLDMNKAAASQLLSKSTPPISEFDDVVASLADQASLGGFSLLIGDGQGVRYSYTRGTSAFGTPITPDTAISVFSSGKWVTSAALGAAVKQGKFTWDDKVSKYIDFWPTDSDDSRSNITFRSCMSLTSGLVLARAFGDAFSMSDMAIDAIGVSVATVGLWNLSQSLEVTVKKIKDASLPTNDGKYRYGETHFFVAAYAALKATGINKWGEFLQKYLAGPSGIADGDYDYKMPMFPAVAPMPDAGVPNPNNCDPGAELVTSACFFSKFLSAYVANGTSLFDAKELDKEHASDCVLCAGPDNYALGHWITPPGSTTPTLWHSIGAWGCMPAVTTLGGKKYWIYVHRFDPYNNYGSVTFAKLLQAEIEHQFGNPPVFPHVKTDVCGR